MTEDKEGRKGEREEEGRRKEGRMNEGREEGRRRRRKEGRSE